MLIVLSFLFNTVCNVAVGILVAKRLGPENYGRFALAVLVASVIQLVVYDWVRAAAARFCSPVAIDDPSKVRATLDTAFVLLTGILLAAGVFAILDGITFGLPVQLASMTLFAAMIIGLFDYQTTLVRGRFNDPLYARLMIGKNLLAIVFMAGGVMLVPLAEVVLTGLCLSNLGTLFLVRVLLRPEQVSPFALDKDLISKCLKYALPMVSAGILYQLLSLTNRSLMQELYGFKETGLFALAYEMGFRLVMALCATIEVLLFQRAVVVIERRGTERGKREVAKNLTIVFALLAPACLGFWLVLPSIELIIVPENFRGPFQHYLDIMMPGLFAWGIMVVGIAPFFQIIRKTIPLIGVALASFATDISLIALLPHVPDNIAVAQSCAMFVALFSLIAISLFYRPAWPKFADFVYVLAGCVAVSFALWPLRSMPPGPLLLLIQVLCGMGIYGIFVTVFNIAGLRTAAWNALRQQKTEGIVS